MSGATKSSIATPHHNLPVQATSFVGRRKEVQELCELMSASGCRLVTLTGPGGTGKTRLALQVAIELLNRVHDGPWLVDLASVSNPELVALEMASAIGIHDEGGRSLLDVLADVIADRQFLIVLDNCEHVLEAAARVVDGLIRTSSRVRFLATSREPLGIGGERIFKVPPLNVPDTDIIDVDELARFDAVRLFVERASTQRADFSLDQPNAGEVGQLCSRLDGLPLAIELAAARLRSMSVSEINSRLDRRFQLLTRGSPAVQPRQQTLKALIDWSYDLLSSFERLVLERLSVFAGGWSMEAAESVVVGSDIEEWRVLDLVAALVDKSLVQVNEVGGNTRYRLLETVRHYAVDRLEQRGEAEAERFRAAHLEHYLAMAETAASHMHGPHAATWLARLDLYYDNLGLAMERCLSSGAYHEAGLRLGISLREFWVSRGHIGEGLHYLAQLLDPECDPAVSPLRPQALNTLGRLSGWAGKYSAAEAYVGEAYARASDAGDLSTAAEAMSLMAALTSYAGDLTNALQQSDDAVGLARKGVSLAGKKDRTHVLADCLMCRGAMRAKVGDSVAGHDDYEEALRLATDQDDRLLIASILGNLAYSEAQAGTYSEARVHLEEALLAAQSVRDEARVVWLANNLGWVSLLTGDHERARDCFLQGLDIAVRIGSTELDDVPTALHGLAIDANHANKMSTAAQLHGAADQILQKDGRNLDVVETGLVAESINRLRDEMGEDIFSEGYGQGARLALSEAVSLAHGLVPGARTNETAGPSPASREAPAAIPGLSEREREIVVLLAEGATDAQIAKRLYLSVNTVRSHLQRIRDKTGLRRRVELARLAAGTDSTQAAK